MNNLIEAKLLPPQKVVISKPESDPASLREFAFRIEEQAEGDNGVTLSRPLARTLKRALFDLADRIDLEKSENADS